MITSSVNKSSSWGLSPPARHARGHSILGAPWSYARQMSDEQARLHLPGLCTNKGE